ncbi:asparagine synthase-related protein [Undibacterium sp. SXout11W]|uniref:asparagine synthase-related protein n=1 Tax=Undibacterium sp. SXout11W TaxID=3413050 RepID=UPI003BF0D651
MALTINLHDAVLHVYPPSAVATKLHAVDSPLLATAIVKLEAHTQLLDYKARLDNRPALAAALGIAACNAALWPTGDLLLRAYQRWGSDMAKHLRGNWWFAIWDGSQRRLILAVDPTGATPLFYTHKNGSIAFAPSLVDLLQLPGVNCGLNEKRILSYLIHWIAYSDYDETEYQDIRQLKPASCLFVDIKTAYIQTYWHPGDWKPVRRACTDQEYIDQFLHLYRKAVSARIAGNQNVATMLSAGLDSGSVSALAAQEMAARGLPLSAYTHVPIPQVRSLHLDNKIVDEWPLAHMTAMCHPNIDHIALQSAALSPLEAYQRGLSMTGRLQSTVVNMPWIHFLSAQVQQRQMHTLLSGQLGNLVVTWDGTPLTLWSQLQQRKWKSAWGCLLNGRTTTAYNIARGMARQTWYAFRPEKDVLTRTFSGLSANPANPHLLAQHKNNFETHAARRKSSDLQNMRAALMPVFIAATGINSLLASAYGFDMLDPTSDQDLIEFCLSVPDDLFARDGHRRWLIREAMQDILPPEVQWNYVRGLQPADGIYRFLSHRDEVETMLEMMQQSNQAQHYLNLPAIRASWERMKPSLVLGDDFSIFQAGIGAGAFFAHVEGKKLPFD